MKTTTIPLKVVLPSSPEALLDGLGSLHDGAPGLARAEAALRDAEERLTAARAAVTERQRHVEERARDVAAGRVAAADLEQAHVALRAAVSVVAPAERRAADAQAALRLAAAAARDGLTEEARRRGEILIAAATALLEQLERIEDLDIQLALHVAQVIGERTALWQHSGYATPRALMAQRRAVSTAGAGRRPAPEPTAR